jgi:hypothetical protein
MALLDFGGSRATQLHEHPPPLTDAQARQSTWQSTGIEVAETFLVLIGIGIGILTLRFVLMLMHGFLH